MTLLACMLLPVAVVYAVLRLPDLAWLARRVAHRVRPRPAPQLPVGPPIEQVAADLRRLGRDLTRLRAAPVDQFRVVRLRGCQLAYDDRLADAARALEVDHRLGCCGGAARRVERARLERALAQRGLDVQPVTGR